MGSQNVLLRYEVPVNDTGTVSPLTTLPTA